MTSFINIITEFHVDTLARCLLLIIVGFYLAKWVSVSLNKVFNKRLTQQQAMLLRRVTFYTILFLFLASAIQQLGFRMTALLGATGILTIAIGIASQTSMSNVISGIFLIGEKPFEIGDTIKLNEIQGEVVAIDFLSVRIRTNENTMVRIPNEILIKSAIINLSFFPIRRIDIAINLNYQNNIEEINKILLDLAADNAYCLSEPAPSFSVLDFGDSAMRAQFSVWTQQENYNDLKNRVQVEIKNAFEKYGIDFPIPSQRFYVGNTVPVAMMTS